MFKINIIIYFEKIGHINHLRYKITSLLTKKMNYKWEKCDRFRFQKKCINERTNDHHYFIYECNISIIVYTYTLTTSSV